MTDPATPAPSPEPMAPLSSEERARAAGLAMLSLHAGDVAALSVERDRLASEVETLRSQLAAAQRERDVAARHRAWRATHQIEGAARDAVANALRDGRLVRPATCQRCGCKPPARHGSRKPGNVEAHHHRGYSPEHQLDVRWLCKPCHAIEDLAGHGE